ncbi:MAG: hypothetical protein ACRYGG_12525 [Janthinobacterium lividum]
MRKLIFEMKVLLGLSWHGIRAYPGKVGRRKRSVADLVVLVLIGGVAAFEILGSGMHGMTQLWLLALLAPILGVAAYGILARRRGLPAVYLQEMKDAREAQIQRMYPSHHARMEELHRRRS